MDVVIKDIAKAAGVSTATVSNVLNGRKNVGEATRERILSLCKEMDYQVNPFGRALKNCESNTILFNFSDFDREFYLKIIHGISDYVYSRQYDLMICTSGSCERFMSKSFTSGCIMLDKHCSDQLLLQKARRGYPVVALDRILEEPNIKSLVVNNYTPMQELVSGIVARGYRRFAFLGGINTLDNRERYAAFCDVLAKNEIPFRHESYLTGDYREKSGYQAAKLLLIGESLPQALVCANDNMAIGAIRALREVGVRVPEDVAVTGFDDTQMAEVLGLTTVSIPNYERGYLAAQSLIANIQGAQSFETFKIQAKVTWRKTVLDEIKNG
ncbi:MAG: LacI family DNA-binding transcriptional regulator [Clostridia bacterium]